MFLRIEVVFFKKKVFEKMLRCFFHEGYLDRHKGSVSGVIKTIPWSHHCLEGLPGPNICMLFKAMVCYEHIIVTVIKEKRTWEIPRGSKLGAFKVFSWQSHQGHLVPHE